MIAINKSPSAVLSIVANLINFINTRSAEKGYWQAAATMAEASDNQRSQAMSMKNDVRCVCTDCVIVVGVDMVYSE